jgi:predicted RNA-binding Zn-ribbon protein involved in translation (DUF1610 family)
VTIQFECPTCGKKLRAPESAAGKKGKCPGCQKVFQVPEPIYEAEEADVPVVEIDEGASEDQPEIDETQDDRRPCPMCGEMIKVNAAKCRFCGEVFDETLERAEKKKRRKKRDTDLETGDYLLAILCSGIGCIMGIIWMIQGKPKGTKMFGLSLLFAFLWGVVNAILQSTMKN